VRGAEVWGREQTHLFNETILPTPYKNGKQQKKKTEHGIRFGVKRIQRFQAVECMSRDKACKTQDRTNKMLYKPQKSK
jgi:hypothetical protein